LVYNCKFTIIFSNCHHFLSFFWIILLKLAGFKYGRRLNSPTAASPKGQEDPAAHPKGQEDPAARPEGPKAHSSNALKGQKLLAQGNALGIRQSAMRPVRAKALKYT
jgi:hypothetical protein